VIDRGGQGWKGGRPFDRPFRPFGFAQGLRQAHGPEHVEGPRVSVHAGLETVGEPENGNTARVGPPRRVRRGGSQIPDTASSEQAEGEGAGKMGLGEGVRQPSLREGVRHRAWEGRGSGTCFRCAKKEPDPGGRSLRNAVFNRASLTPLFGARWRL